MLSEAKHLAFGCNECTPAFCAQILRFAQDDRVGAPTPHEIQSHTRL